MLEDTESDMMDSNVMVRSSSDCGKSRSGKRGSGSGAMTLSAMDAVSSNCFERDESMLRLAFLTLCTLCVGRRSRGIVRLKLNDGDDVATPTPSTGARSGCFLGRPACSLLCVGCCEEWCSSRAVCDWLNVPGVDGGPVAVGRAGSARGVG